MQSPGECPMPHVNSTVEITLVDRACVSKPEYVMREGELALALLWVNRVMGAG